MKNKKKQKIKNKMAVLNHDQSMITLNVNGLNMLIKRQLVEEWIKKYTQLYAVYIKLTSNIIIKR